MSMIFPGMDPYLEKPQIWPGNHNRLMVYIADHLQPQLRPRYVASVEERVYVEGPGREIIPDVHLKRRPRPDVRESVAVAEADLPDLVRVSELEIHENYVEILDLLTGETVVTSIELVSPTNKYAGPGRDSYLNKQREVLASQTHLIEIDLLRSGPHVLAVPEYVARSKKYDYLVSVNRAWDLREEFELYRRRLPERLPKVRVPLAGDDPDVVMDLQLVVNHLYEAADMQHRLNYDAPCVPPLSPEDQAWADQLIRQAKEAAAKPPA